MNCWFESRSSRQIYMRGKQRPQEEQAEIEQHCPHPCIVLAVMEIECKGKTSRSSAGVAGRGPRRQVFVAGVARRGQARNQPRHAPAIVVEAGEARAQKAL